MKAANKSAAASFVLAVAMVVPTLGYGQSNGPTTAIEAGNSPQPSPEPRLNQLQWIGTHNPYHIESNPNEASPDLSYTHATLPQQLSMGLRFFELDIQRPVSTGRNSAANPLEVFHEIGIDEGSHCRAFRLCLEQIRSFVQNSPNAGPVFVQLELKVRKGMHGQHIAQFVSAVGSEIAGKISRESLLVPSDIADRVTNLRAAVQQSGWPLVSVARGKIIFILNSSDRVTQIYLRMLRSDFSKIMFSALNDPNDPSAAVINFFDPSRNEVCAASQSGQLVITYADWRTTAARENNTAQRDAAFKSGAQLIATDFPMPDPHKSEYQVSFAESSLSNLGPYVRARPSCNIE